MISTCVVRNDDKIRCEDNLWLSVTDGSVKGAIMDGCGSGVESSFASSLLKKIINECYREDSSFAITSDLFIYRIMTKLGDVKNCLNLNNNEIWSTLILFEYDINTHTLLTRVLGDGIIVKNGSISIIDTGAVDYLGSHLEDKFDYIHSCPLIIDEDILSFRISSDGLYKVECSQFNDKNKIDNPVDYLLEEVKSPTQLDRRVNILKRQGYKFKDDLSIIAYDN
jgi:hypothetical protein